MADHLAAARENLPKRANTFPQSQADQHTTYRVAHSAKCKLQMAANAPDRNLRFVLGHAFTLDNLLLRIVEIENQSAKEELDNSKPDKKAEETKQSSSPRRVSFSGSSNFKPSAMLKGQSTENTNRKRAKSPPPAGREYDGESTESDDEYDDPQEFADTFKPKSAIPPQGRGANAHDSDSYDDDLYEEDDNPTSLQRFDSASARPPRQPSPPAENVPDLEEDEGEEEDDFEPESPPSLPEDKIREALSGEVDEELGGLYNGIKKCPCNHHHKLVPDGNHIYDVKGFEGEEGKRYAVIRA